MPEAAARAALERLRASRRPRALFIAHAERGGVARHVAALACHLAADLEIVLLRPHAPAHVSLSWRRDEESVELFLEPSREWDALVGLLRGIGIDHLHVHHVHGLPAAVLDLPRRLGCAHDVTLHDYFPACPNYHLTDGSGRYCAADPGCLRCTEARPAQWEGSIADWREAFRPFLLAARRVIAPSEDAARRILRFYPGAPVVTWPHPEDAASGVHPPARVLVPGAISRAKGLDLLEACAADAMARRLPMHFRILGFVGRKLPLWPAAPLSICGEYPEGRLDELIALERGDVVFFPAQCPETFSYTLSAALDSGLPIVATDLGAFPERLAAAASIRIVPWRSSAAEMNDALLAVARPRASFVAERERMSFEAYRDRYLSGIQPVARHSDGELPTVDGSWLAKPSIRPRPVPLATLFEDGVLCGRRDYLEGLRRYAFDPDSLYADADARVRELIEARAAAEEKLARLEADRRPGLGTRLQGLVRWIRERFA